MIVKEYTGRAIGAAFLLLGNYADALDASQDAFVRAWRNIRRFDGKGTFYTWYSAILRNTCISRLRRRPRNRPVQLANDYPGPESISDPGVLAERNERIDRIWQAVLELSTKHREIIVMSHFQQMSYKQIACVLKVPIGTVMSRLYNARKTLRAKLACDRP